ncbi:MAG TPA: NAD-glutamate dehydrogenase domain-containing protein, partial [Candidatus Binataceae bacterium]
MAVQDMPSDDGRNGRSLLGAAAAALVRREPGIPADFIEKFFGRAAPDDLERYQPEQLAAIAVQSWATFAARRQGTAKVRLAAAAMTPGVTALDIINDDMPFLVDSVIGELTERGLAVLLLVHPVFLVERDQAGTLTGFEDSRHGEGRRESFIHIHIDGAQDEAAMADLARTLEHILDEVRVCVQDWQAMLGRAREAIAELRKNPPPLPVEEIAEAVQFLEWLTGDNFTLLGSRDYAYTDHEQALQPIFETGLGLLRSRDMRLLRRGNQLVTITPEIREFLEEPRLLIVAKAAVRARVHRRVNMDYVGVKRFDAEGKLIGERRFCGLFTSTAYTRSTRAIPYLRRKVDHIIRRAGFEAHGHSGKALVNVLETYPRDELFQIDEDTLYRFALAILQLGERPRVRVLPRSDRFDRFVSVLVYVPRDRYDSAIRAQIGDYLAATYKGRLRAFYPFFPEGPLVRVHFIIGRYEGETPNPDPTELDSAVEAIVQTWVERLEQAIGAEHKFDSAHRLFARYREAFPIDYREVYRAATALADIGLIEALSPDHPLGVDLYQSAEAAPAAAGLRVFSLGRPIPLSERVPVLENMGFCVVDERTYAIRPENAAEVWFHDVTIETASGEAVALAARKDQLEACFLAVMSGAAENDGYNALVLTAGLPWRDVAIIRTISRFLRQIRVPYSQDYMWGTLRKHARIAAAIVSLFHVRFAPRFALVEEARAANETEIAATIDTALQAVSSLDEDRILRHFVNAVMAAVRTNFFQLDDNGRAKEPIAIKFASRKVDGMPLPRPLYEVFVYSPRVEALHLRFGKVARGGIRWSDRPQDFRTEILGLVKAQNVKNAVIVPVGAKG